MRKNILLFLLAGLLSLFNTPVLADSLAKVNLIIFTHINKQTLSSEAWPHFLAKPDSQSAISLAPSYAPEPNDRLLPATQIGMENVVSRLRNNGYNIVINNAWNQVISTNSPWIHIVGGQAYNAEGKPTSAADAVYWEINGYVRISSQSGFMLDGNLFLTVPSAENNGSTPLRSYRLNGKQILKFNQFGYLDHPLFGLLIYLTPQH